MINIFLLVVYVPSSLTQFEFDYVNEFDYNLENEFSRNVELVLWLLAVCTIVEGKCGLM